MGVYVCVCVLACSCMCWLRENERYLLETKVVLVSKNLIVIYWLVKKPAWNALLHHQSIIPEPEAHFTYQYLNVRKMKLKHWKWTTGIWLTTCICNTLSFAKILNWLCAVFFFFVFFNHNFTGGRMARFWRRRSQRLHWSENSKYRNQRRRLLRWFRWWWWRRWWRRWRQRKRFKNIIISLLFFLFCFNQSFIFYFQK